MKTVIFKRIYGCYNKGDVAGFLPAQADEMIKKGIAAAYVESVPMRKGADTNMVKKKA
jgi:hypothetical protein